MPEDGKNQRKGSLKEMMSDRGRKNQRKRSLMYVMSARGRKKPKEKVTHVCDECPKTEKNKGKGHSCG
ncbi:hypothetical protein AFL42_06755 [Oceanobacillus caeni]|uniref:Uncharacterized protein n=1 Tax=Oceanobacillus caeni TaxID=405946 RepID=A0ABR5MKQ1_9BACI|nr:hypothetical protein AFL42_06755 [Oceanobacillus caeni]